MPAIHRIIDLVNVKVGYLAALLSVPLVGVVAFEVFMRYVLGRPTIWGFEATCFIFGMSWALGLGFTHQHDGHVAVDFVEAHLSARKRTCLRIVTSAVLFLPANALLAVGSITYAADAWHNLERNSTSWAPAIYPYKTAMAIGFVLLLAQGVAKLVRDVRSLRAPAAVTALPAAERGVA